MSCCAPGVEACAQPQRLPGADELRDASRDLGDGRFQLELAVPAIHCGACIRTVETALGRLAGVDAARVNLSTQRVTVRWHGEEVPPVAATLAGIGYPPHIYDPSADVRDDVRAELLRAVAVSGFAAGNIMLLSVSVWSGADGATRDLFHWVSALIALPALAFAGRIYFRSAWSALRHGRLNMDVPITIGVSLAYAMSLYETVTHGPHAYFDASVTLLFFLLIGRTLDHLMRERARSAVAGLARLQPRGALVVADDGTREYTPLAELRPGMRLMIAAGERLPVDARIAEGTSELDVSLVSGESEPFAAVAGMIVRAGTLNLTGPLTLTALKGANESFLAEMMRMMEAAEGGRSVYRRIAERVSSWYAPVVHLGALATFAGWMVASGDWHRAMTIAIAVLIITCPCALGLAVPIVQVVAARRLFEAGIMVKDGTALERLAEADSVVLDKTGTLTASTPRLANADRIDPEMLETAAALAALSRHPRSRAIAAFASGTTAEAFDGVRELSGLGIEARSHGRCWRLGRRSWAVTENGTDDSAGAGTVLSMDGREVAAFEFDDRLRPGVRPAVAELAATVGPVEMLSGDTNAACRQVACRVGIAEIRAELLPTQKVQRLATLAAAGRKVLMVGDGLNDAPALATAHVSMAPGSAADVGRDAADLVFLRDDFGAVPLALKTARRADRLVRQNLALAVAYNAVAVPIAVFGHVTPLIAAIAMSASSILVIANALRLGSDRAVRDDGVPAPVEVAA